ncbi:hypothetical protein MTO96_035990 [Rhipicephalus appendiculatus]
MENFRALLQHGNISFRGMFPKSIVDAFIYTWGETTVGTDVCEDNGPGFANAIQGFNSFGLINFAVLLGLVLGERCCDDDIIFDILEGFASTLLRISQLLAWFVHQSRLHNQVHRRTLGHGIQSH